MMTALDSHWALHFISLKFSRCKKAPQRKYLLFSDITLQASNSPDLVPAT